MVSLLKSYPWRPRFSSAQLESDWSSIGDGLDFDWRLIGVRLEIDWRLIGDLLEFNRSLA